MGRDLAIDLGTANTIVYRQGEGIVFDEPTVVALHANTGAVVAIGEAAWDLIGGDSGNVGCQIVPLCGGLVSDEWDFFNPRRGGWQSRLHPVSTGGDERLGIAGEVGDGNGQGNDQSSHESRGEEKCS
jgi:hypothetical protein